MREDSGGARGLIRSLFPLAALLAFEAAFALAVMLLDRNNRALPSNAAYVALVEGLVIALALFIAIVRGLKTRGEIAKAALSPLDSVLPPTRTYEAGLWKELLVGARAQATREAAERAAHSTSELEAFLATVHALKTPATALTLMADRAAREGLPLEPGELRLEIEELDRILDRAIGTMRLEDFERGSRIAAVDAAEAARASLRKHRRILIARKLGVSVEGSFMAATDPWWLAFILDQLLSNAAKYASSRLEIRLSASGRKGLIEIADDGPGLDEEDESRAFFRSATGSAAGAAELGPSSSGYGLHLAREASLRLGADLGIGPRPGGEKGSLASLRLPLAAGAEDKLTPM